MSVINDPKQLKNSLKSFLSSQSEFTDYNFEGSTLSTLLDLFSRNSHYIAILANMMVNESFLDSAQLRSSIVSHARKLSYVPSSQSASTSYIDLKLIPSDKTSLPSSITMDKGKMFFANAGNDAKTFVNLDQYTLTLDGNNDYIGTNIELKQGRLSKNSFIYDGVSVSKFEIPNKNIDTSTLKVSVNGILYVKNINIIDIDGTTKCYFLYENDNGLYDVEFGDNILGIAISNNDLIEIEYITTDNDHFNGAILFNLASSINGYTNSVISNVITSTGGSDRESVEHIKNLAVKAYSSQNRAVTPFDYEVLTLKGFPTVKSVKAWGGEKNNPPRFGSVFLSMNDTNNNPVDSVTKSNIISYLDDYNVGSITPIIVDPEFVFINIKNKFSYLTNETSNSIPTVKVNITNVCTNYSDNDLESFGKNFIYSDLIEKINNLDGVGSPQSTMTMYKEFTSITSNNVYTINFNNEIVQGTLSSNILNINNLVGSTLNDDNGILYANTTKVGVIDYINGIITLSVTFLAIELVTLEITPKNQNIISVNNSIIEIDSIVNEVE